MQLLRVGKPDAYDKALEAVRDDTRGWWQEQLEDADEDDEHPYTRDAAGLQRFLEGDVTAWYDTHRKELENRPVIRVHALAEAFDPDRLDRASVGRGHSATAVRKGKAGPPAEMAERPQIPSDEGEPA